MPDQNDKDAILVKILLDDSTTDKQTGQFADKVKKNLGKDLGTFKIVDFEAISEEGTSAFADIAGSLGRIGLIGAAVGVTLFGVKKALDFGLEGEKIKAINAQFEMLSRNAGIVPEALRAGLEKSGDGLVNMESLLQKSNSAIIALGDNATKLPQILTLARKAAAAMGGDVGDHYSNIVTAIETGNAKALKAEGIYLDLDEVMKNYAHSIGLAAGDLNVAQKQQAVMNATLLEGEKRFAGVSTSVNKAGDDWTRAKNSFSGIIDNFKKFIATSKPFQDSMAALAKWMNYFEKGPPLKEQREELVKQLESFKKMPLLPNGLPRINKKDVAEITEKIAAIDKLIDAQKKAEDSENKNTNAVKNSLTPKQKALILARELGLQEIANQANLARNTLQDQNTGLLDSQFSKNIASQALYQERALILKQQYETQSAQIEAQHKAQEFATEQEYQAKKLQIATQYGQALGQVQLEQRMLAKSLTDSISDGSYFIDSLFGDLTDDAKNYQLSWEDAANGIKKSFKSIAKEGVNSLGNGLGKGFAAFGEALVNGKNGLEAFANTFLASVGEMAVASGTRFILEGLAWMWVPGMEGVGGAMIAAGAALAAFGGALGAIMANSSGASSSSSGGGVDSTETGSTSVTDPQNLERQDPSTSVYLTVEGSIFDTEATGLRLADILNTMGAQNGLKILRT